MQLVVSVLGHYKVLASDGIAPHCYQLKEILPKTKNEKNNKKAYHYVFELYPESWTLKKSPMIRGFCVFLSKNLVIMEPTIEMR
ncbi:hypothetical protein PDN41_23755, partial [Bacillus cereus]|nr:hypothetical protein [Bacillus cereus]